MDILEKNRVDFWKQVTRKLNENLADDTPLQKLELFNEGTEINPKLLVRRQNK